MNASEALRHMVLCVQDLKRTQGTATFNVVLRRLYRQAEMVMHPSAIPAPTEPEAVTVAVTSELGTHLRKRRHLPMRDYTAHRLKSIEKEADVEELRCAGL